MSELPKLRRTFPELIVEIIPAPVYTKPHEPIDYSKVDWSGKTKKGELHKGSALDLHSDGQCSIHCSPTMFLFVCDYCKLKRYSNENRLPSLWVRNIWVDYTYCHSCNLQYGVSHLIKQTTLL